MTSESYVAGGRFTLSLYTGYIPSMRIRRFLYRHLFKMKIGENSVIYGGAEIRAPSKIEIEDRRALGIMQSWTDAAVWNR